MKIRNTLFLVFFLSSCFIGMAASITTTLGSSEAAVYIVYTERTQDEEESEAYHLRILTAVLGSEEAAKEALLYSYEAAASGFSAKLTPEQVKELSKQPGILQVVPSRTLKLHPGPKMPYSTGFRNLYKFT